MAVIESKRTGAQRQSAFTSRKIEAGARLVKAWLPSETITALKSRYPGPRGGIDWPAVAEVALKD